MLVAEDLILALTVINFVLPLIMIISVIYLRFKFSGIPKRDEYKSRMKKLHWAVILWSVMRLTRAITSIWDINILFGMFIDMT